MLKISHTDCKIEAGVDEVGRGCLAGPVVAAAVILPADYNNTLLNDSKKINEKTRIILCEQIKQDAIAWAIGEASAREIEEINILKASFLAMHRALDQLKTCPEYLLIDGNRFIKYKDIDYLCVVKGDATYQSIAAASIIAKTYRDDLMKVLDQQHPGYDWARNVGYPTKKHREGIQKLGITDHHRKTFQLLPSQLTIFS